MAFIPIEYPVVKPHKCCSTIILKDLIHLAAYSKDKKEGEKCVQRIINNSQICQKERKISPIEISELRVIETFLLDVKRYYRIFGDIARFRLYSANNAEFNNWMMFLVGLLMCSVFYYHYGAPTSFQLLFVMLFLAILLLMLESGKLFERLYYDIPFPEEESNVRNEGKWLRLKFTPVHTAQSMEKEQLALIDLRREEVLPVKEEYHRLNTEAIKMKIQLSKTTESPILLHQDFVAPVLSREYLAVNFSEKHAPDCEVQCHRFETVFEFQIRMKASRQDRSQQWNLALKTKKIYLFVVFVGRQTLLFHWIWMKRSKMQEKPNGSDAQMYHVNCRPITCVLGHLPKLRIGKFETYLLSGTSDSSDSSNSASGDSSDDENSAPSRILSEILFFNDSGDKTVVVLPSDSNSADFLQREDGI